MYRKVLIAALIGAAFTVPGYAITATHMVPMQTHPSVLPSLLVKRYWAVESLKTRKCFVTLTKPDGTTRDAIGSPTGFATRAEAEQAAGVDCPHPYGEG